MKAFFGFITALTIPLMVLNMLGGVVSGIWLGILGQWGTIIGGVLFFFISTWLLSFALMPSLLLAAPAAYCAEKGKILGFVFFGALSNLYTFALITIWCCGLLFLYVKGATTSSLIPRLIWSYGVATGPWAYMASKEQGPEGEGFASSVSTFLAELAFLVIMLLVIFTPITFIGAIKVFAGFMLVGFVVQMSLSVLLMNEQKRYGAQTTAFVGRGQIKEKGDLQEIVELQPDTATDHYNFGLTLGVQGQLEEAITEYRKAIRLDPDYGEAHYQLGVLLEKRGEVAEAEKEFRVAIRLKPDFVHYNYGLTLMNQKRYTGAEHELREAIRAKPEYHEAHFYLGYVLSAQGKYAMAEKEYYEAIRLKPDDPVAHFNLGVVFAGQGKNDESIAEYREAIRLNPDYDAAHYGLGFVLGRKKETVEAVMEYREAIRLNPDNAVAHFGLGFVLGKKEETVEAVKEYREAIRLNPDYAAAHYNLGWMLWQQGKVEAAIAEYREAIRLKPDYAEALVNLAIYLDQKGEREKAREYWVRALKSEKRQEWLAMIYERLAEPR